MSKMLSVSALSVEVCCCMTHGRLQCCRVHRDFSRVNPHAAKGKPHSWTLAAQRSYVGNKKHKEVNAMKGKG